MPINNGVIAMTCEDGDVEVLIYYDNSTPADDSQPLINGPRGWCLDISNRSGRRASLTVTGLAANPIQVTIARGDPVTTGPAAGRSRTAAQMASAGYTTRGSLGELAISC
jgi:hypothetical protein